MRLKTSATFLLGCFLLIFFVGCKSSDELDNRAFNAEETLAELDGLLMQLDQFDASDCENLNDIVTINERMRRIIEGIHSPKEFDELAGVFDAGKHKIGFLVSEDDLFGVFYWQTNMDCLGQSIKNIALYKSGDRLLVSSLYGKPMIYEKLTSEKMNQNKTIYLLHSRASKQNQTVTKAYTIANTILVESQIPPSEQRSNRHTISTIQKETDSISSQ